MTENFRAILNPEHHHVAIRVKDMRTMMHFYGGVLGLPYIRELAGDPLPKVVWYQAVQLIASSSDDDPRSGVMDHLAISVLNIDEITARIESAGIPLEAPIAHQDVPAISLHLDNVFFRDPEGNRVELVQWVPLKQ
ncbi:MAG: VOC family protein [Chloroflexi bacterium]|nr:VOC family protein [Chloroflexota bacterium]